MYMGRSVAMKVGFVQFNPVFGEVDANIAKTLSLIEKIDKADLLVLPELFNTGYLIVSQGEIDALAEEIPHGKTTQALSTAARERSCFIVAGIAEREGDRIYNSAVLVGPQGYMGTYRKIHLFFEEKRWFSPGDRGFGVYDIGPCRLGIMICFDWIFPESMRTLSLKGAHIICHPANLVLPFCQDAMRTRCLENRVYAITANRTGLEERNGKSLYYTGKSQVMGPDADLIVRSEEDVEETQVVEIDIARSEKKSLNEYNDLFKDRRPEFYKN